MALIEQRFSTFVFAPIGMTHRINKRLALWRSRRALAKLDPRLLDDIGVTAEEARREARLAIWDAPEYWTK